MVRGLIVPGLNGSGPKHWQTLWEQKFKFERVEQRDWANPDIISWTEMLDSAISAHPDRVVIVAHSLGCWTVINWAASHLDRSARVHSALLVVPPDLTSDAALPDSAMEFICHQSRTLPFPSILVGSENDPYLTLENAWLLSVNIGSYFVNAGLVGHINIESGHGSWSEGEALLQGMLIDARDTDAASGILGERRGC